MKGMFRQRKGGMCRGTAYPGPMGPALFLYSVLGWVWESCYVSLKSRQWVNRGVSPRPLAAHLWLGGDRDPFAYPARPGPTKL